MRFRTEIERPRTSTRISHTDRIITVGSCFSDAIGRRLMADGFNVAVNPMGVLFNPISIHNFLTRVLDGREYTMADLYRDSSGIYHALDFESRRQGPEAETLLAELNADFAKASRAIRKASVIFVTFGTAWVFRHIPSDERVVGNCHKLPDSEFLRSFAYSEEIYQMWKDLVDRFTVTEGNCRMIFTVSPVRHLNDGLHGNTLSKSHLHLAVESLRVMTQAEYFPAYEALMDDLRDYRFYADDLLHPSTMAEDYIYNLLSDTYFDKETKKKAQECHKEYLRANHRSIIK